MAYHSTVEFVSRRQLPMANPKGSDAPYIPKLSAFAEELALMDVVIPMTLISKADEVLGSEPSVWNILNLDKAEITNAPVVPRRLPRKSRAQQGRIVALRRHATLVSLQKSPLARRVSRVSSKTELRTLRSCILGTNTKDTAMSLPLRLATHTISMALIVTALPVGIALLCHNVVKGEDMRATARLTTLSGMALAAISGNPWLSAIVGA